MLMLNSKQQKAALFRDGICCVIATPGSGKTLTMTERIYLLIMQHSVSPDQILALTFTRNAAQAMRERLEERLYASASRVELSTIHRFCAGVLKEAGKSFEIISGQEQLFLIKKAMELVEMSELSAGELLRQISLAKNNLITADEMRCLYDLDFVMLKAADVFEIYEEMKRPGMLLDFDDLLLEVNSLLNDDILREKYRKRFRHILVDEFQDSSSAQVAVLKQLAGEKRKGASFWVCGDDMQSIYGFNGASVANIVNFKRLFPGAKRFILDLNYRSTPPIVSACQNLIEHSKKRIRKRLKASQRYGGTLSFLKGANEEEEAELIANEITELMGRHTLTLSEMAVLYRSNFQLRVIEEVFSRRNVAYRVEGASNFFKRQEIRPLLDYMQLIVSPDSNEGDEALKRIINIPNRYVAKLFLNELEAHCGSKGCHLFSGLKSISIPVPYLRRNVRDFIALMAPLMKKAGDFEPSELIYLLRENLDYDRFVTDENIPSPDDTKIANINQLQFSALKHKEIGSFLKYTESFEHEGTSDREGVFLMTIHKSKGLQFTAVFVAGLVDGILPNKNGDFEEERRICFVAVSRAKEFLYLSHSETILGQPAKPSPFLDEIKGLKQ